MVGFLTKGNSHCLVKDIDGKKGIVTGYLSSFGNIDSDNDMIMPGSYTKTLKERGPESKAPRIKHLLFHDSQKLIGKFLVLKEDSKGLYFESKLSVDSTLGRDALAMYEDGLITEHSIGFNIEKEDNSRHYREIQEIRLWEGSGVTWGSNPETPITGIKSKDSILSRIEKINKQLRVANYSDETFLLLESQLKQLEASLNNEPGLTTHVAEPTVEQLFSIIKNQIKN